MAGTIKHYWNGTTLVVTSDSGTSACDLKGEKGDIGVRGVQGAPGVTDSGAPLLAQVETAEYGEFIGIIYFNFSVFYDENGNFHYPSYPITFPVTSIDGEAALFTLDEIRGNRITLLTSESPEVIEVSDFTIDRFF